MCSRKIKVDGETFHLKSYTREGENVIEQFDESKLKDIVRKSELIINYDGYYENRRESNSIMEDDYRFVIRRDSF